MKPLVRAAVALGIFCILCLAAYLLARSDVPAVALLFASLFNGWVAGVLHRRLEHIGDRAIDAAFDALEDKLEDTIRILKEDAREHTDSLRAQGVKITCELCDEEPATVVGVEKGDPISLNVGLLAACARCAARRLGTCWPL